MMFPVSTGGDNEPATREAAGLVLMRLGTHSKTIFLNGGSDTRSGAIEHWREFARLTNIGCRVIGRCMVVLGGDLKNHVVGGEG